MELPQSHSQSFRSGKLRDILMLLSFLAVVLVIVLNGRSYTYVQLIPAPKIISHIQPPGHIPKTERRIPDRNPELWGLKQQGAQLLDLSAVKEDFFNKLRSSHVKFNISAVVLTQRRTTPKVYVSIVPRYYQWIASPHLCDIIIHQNPIPRQMTKNYQIYYTNDCKTDQNLSYIPTTLDPKFEKTSSMFGVEKHFPNISTFFIVLKEAFIPGTPISIYTSEVRLTPMGCKAPSPSPMPSYKGATVEDTVFVVNLYWGSATYHGVAEGLTRLGPYIQALRRRTDVKIHMGNNNLPKSILEFLGFDKSRFIHGPTLARTVLVPEGTSCGEPRPFGTQLFYQEVQIQLRKHRRSDSRDTIVLIKRSHERRMIHYEEIKKGVQDLANEYGLRFVEFLDTKLPPFNETLDIYHRSVQIVAPHGAGFVNMFFAQPGTFITEALCGLAHINLCFTRLAYLLGHHYQGVPEQTGCLGTIDIQAPELLAYVKRNLEEWKRKGTKVFTKWTAAKDKIQWDLEKLGDQTEINKFLPSDDWLNEIQRKDIDILLRT